MRELIEAADPDKLANALERLRAVRAAWAGALNDDERPLGERPHDIRARNVKL